MLPKVPSFIPSFSRNNSNKSSLCHHCKNDESPNMNNLNEVCGESLFMLDMLCINYVSWNQDEYCQHSCFVNGNGHPGNFCCEATENPSTIPSYVPSGTPSTVPSCFPCTFPSRMPTIADSWAPSQHPSFDPSHTPSNITTIYPSAVPFGESSVNPSNTPSSSLSLVPSKESSKGPSLFLLVHQLFPTNQAYAIIAKMMNILIWIILMKSVVNQYLSSICCVIMMLAGIRINTVNAVALLLEMALQAILLWGDRKSKHHSFICTKWDSIHCS